MALKTVIEKGWIVDSDVNVNNASTMGVVGPSPCTQIIPTCHIASHCINPATCGGGGLNGPACQGSPVGCNMPTNEPNAQY